MKHTLPISLLVALAIGCQQKPAVTGSTDIDTLAQKYVQLALKIGQYDEAFVDAYFGPDSLKPSGERLKEFPKDSFIHEVKSLQQALQEVAEVDTASGHRVNWLNDQLVAFEQRIRIFSGEYGLFDQESENLFGTSAPVFNENHYQRLVDELDQQLPGEGTAQERFQSLANRFIIPKEKLDTVFRAAIDYCRQQTLSHYTLPAEEDFTLEFVTDKSWNGYNWYKGNYQSLIQINTDLDIFIDRAIDVGSHESYPGHHVYNMLLEKNLYRDNGLIEFSVYPLYSPQSLIAEGSANYGIDLVFPEDEKNSFAGSVLLPLAGLDTTGISLYFKAMETKKKLNFVRNDVGRGLLSGAMTEQEAVRWLETYGLYNHETAVKSIRFIRNHRSYVINYNHGLSLVADYIEAQAGDDQEKRWVAFESLLSHQIRTSDLNAGVGSLPK